ncbi:protease FtsH subunit HflK [Hephaestia caeni]|uniref:Protease FtsH subunit HflK n=1 Tax=Hephaestia caeni TaxID=645617 RepID=A0A397NQR0_9SPHN|nr:protease modulator HflK [Hephaestia caeni]RIA37527.1 protease FtsH subunit HflK [Hephaestia caeni]
MTILTRWWRRLPILANESKGPWGSGGNDGGGDRGPRNPWTVPPGAPRGRSARPTVLDEFLKRARGGGGGPGSGGGGGGLPGGANGRSLAIIGIVLLLGVWVVFTSFHVIGPQQRGVVTLFGRYTKTLDPGYKVTLPAPFNSVQKVDVQAIRTDDFPEGDATNLMLTGDQNLIDLNYQVRWNVKNPQNYVFEIKDPAATLRATAESAMRAVIATSTLNDAIGPGQSRITQRVQELMQQILDSYGSGLQVQGVALRRVDPPAAVIDEFKAVSAAQQSAQSDINQAHTYAEQIIARAQGEAAQFDKVYEQYKLAPEVTRRRMYYETMENVLGKAHKTVIEDTRSGVVPYLPLNNAAGARPAPAAPAATPAPAQGGGQ